MEYIAVVSAHESVIVRGIRKKLEECGYNVGLCSENYKEIDVMTGGTDLFLFYLSNNIVDNQIACTEIERISELLLARAKPVILVGDENYKDALFGLAPSLKRHIWMPRPLDLTILPDIVDAAIERIRDMNTKKRILIVDDDPTYGKMMREGLKEGFDIDLVASGMQAISYLTNTTPDLILLDYEMPIVDGPQVFRMLRSQPETDGIPIVFLTGVSEVSSVSKVLDLKPDGYVLKSTSSGDLMMYINNLFEKLRSK